MKETLGSRFLQAKLCTAIAAAGSALLLIAILLGTLLALRRERFIMLRRLIRSGQSLAEREKVNRLNSRLMVSAVEVIEAAYWLIGGNNYSQSLVMLDSAIELILKGELERIHRILIADAKNLDNFQVLKSLLRDA